MPENSLGDVWNVDTTQKTSTAKVPAAVCDEMVIRRQRAHMSNKYVYCQQMAADTYIELTYK